MIKARILQKEKLTTKLLTNRPDLKAKFDNLSIQATDIENYKGAYIVTPSSESQMLVTKNKRMTDNVTVEAVPPINLQKKAIVPSKEAQYVKPDEGYDGLAEVAVGVIPPAYIIPSGEKNITSNGKHDVRDYEAVDVDVPIPDGYIKPKGVLEITDNGEYDVTQKAGVNVNVPKGAVLPTLSAPANETEVFESKEYIDENGIKKTGTFSILSEVTEQNGIIAQIKSALQGKASGGGDGSDLPQGYERVDFIEFTGNQLVDTGIIGNQDTQIDTSFTWGNAVQNHVFGCASADNTASITSYMNGSWRFGNEYATKSVNKNNTLLPYAARVNKTMISVTGSNTTISDVDDFETIGTLLVGGARNSSGALPGTGFVGRVFYHFSIKQNDEQVLKLIPVTDGNGTYRFWDLVNKEFFDSITDTPLQGGSL